MRKVLKTIRKDKICIGRAIGYDLFHYTDTTGNISRTSRVLTDQSHIVYMYNKRCSFLHTRFMSDRRLVYAVL